MKKYLFLLLAAFVCASSSAQLVTSTTTTKIKGKSKTIWYVKAGANVSSVSADTDGDLSSVFGYHIGIAFDRQIGSGGAFWSMGLQLGTKGWKYTYEDDYESKLTANKIEIPLSFGYKYAINDDFTVDGRVGGFVNYDLWGTVKEYDEGYEYEYDLDEWNEYEDRDNLSAGILVGVGVWYQKLNFNITYECGLVEQDYCKERTWMIGLGYAF